jgi:NAD(P)-dependent dehydrogenase (short-subunit alcohol dehydrogenase family)
MVLQIADRNIGQLTDIEPSPPELPRTCPATRKSGLSRGGWPQAFVVSAAEIRGPALFLGSAASDYMTGQILVTDGGCMAK